MSVPPSKQLKSPPYPVAPENPPAWSRWARSIMSMLDVTFRKITKQVTDIVINMPDLTTGVQGDVMYNNGTKWTGLGYGTAGKKLQTNGAAADPTWETVTATSVTNTPAGNIASTDVQAAINELDTEKAAASHNHAAGDVTSGTFDTARIPAITEAMQSLSDNTTCDVSSSKHGYVPKLTNDTTKFLRDDGVFATIPSDHGWTNEAHTGNARLTDLDANMIHTTTGMAAGDFSWRLDLSSGKTIRILSNELDAGGGILYVMSAQFDSDKYASDPTPTSGYDADKYYLEIDRSGISFIEIIMLDDGSFIATEMAYPGLAAHSTMVTDNLEDCETGWTAGTSVTASYSTDKKEGTYSLKLHLDAARSAGDVLASIDLSGHTGDFVEIADYIGMILWAKSSSALATESIRIKITRSGGTSPITYYLPLLAANTWKDCACNYFFAADTSITDIAIEANASLSSGLDLYFDALKMVRA